MARKKKIPQNLVELARSLRRKGTKLNDIKTSLEAEGVTISLSVICQLTKDVPCKENRGRTPIYTREEMLERKRAYGRKHYWRTKALETPEEREERLAYKRLMYRASKEAAQEASKGQDTNNTKEEGIV